MGTPFPRVLSIELWERELIYRGLASIDPFVMLGGQVLICVKTMRGIFQIPLK